ncbi:putative XRE family transcriptional regulators [Candidatus Termititenax aidoneus]|uniref:XRE family transcriptional regulators n=1 Tax=Termititenax aidoneus TaxID=2218524 RepID=A0A388T949_TERA1|nr:putative XRE family transcriptional regulators [Candidatus Termititenax aidoneus]
MKHVKTRPKSIFAPRYIQFISDLVKIRKKKNWSQRKLAEVAKVSNCFIGRTETKERRLDLIETIDLMKHLGLSKAEIIKKIGKLL